MSARDKPPLRSFSLKVVFCLSLVAGSFLLHNLDEIFLHTHSAQELLGAMSESASLELDDGVDCDHDFALIIAGAGGLWSQTEIKTQQVCQADLNLSISPLLPPPRFS